VAYMEQEEQLVMEVRGKLRKVTSEVLFSPKYDVDLSGELSSTEFKAALHDQGLHFSKLDFQKVMRVVDPDQSDTIDKEELEEFLATGQIMIKKVRQVLLMATPLKDLFEQFGSNGTTLTKSQLKEALASKTLFFSHEDFDKLMRVLDVSGDGIVDLQEVNQFIKQGLDESGSQGTNPLTRMVATPNASPSI